MGFAYIHHTKKGPNKVIRHKIYPLPLIQEILNKWSGYKYFTKIDISMQYYTFKLTDAAKDLCVIMTPFGKFRYKRVPMGIKQSPEFAQEVMEDIFCNMTNIEVYMDDIGIFAQSWEHHQTIVAKVQKRLEDKGFTVNPLKCMWAVKETNWLGYWLRGCVYYNLKIDNP
jgi:hypothetical protein